ncbi:MAG: fucose isomerase, partial [Planctomycetota bacterium]
MKKTIQLIASGDLRESANLVCWPAQQAMESVLVAAIEQHGYSVKRGHEPKPGSHGFISSQRQGLEVFADLDPAAPLIVAEAVWQYSHHVLAGLTTHRGPILTVANWSGQWPGLVGLLNLNGSLTKAGVPYSSLWSETFADDWFHRQLGKWLLGESIDHDTSHVTPFDLAKANPQAQSVGHDLA